MTLISYGMSDPGCVRPVNQDRILLDDTLGLYVVCDGIGGRRRGDIAADLAASTIHRSVESSRDPQDVTWPYGYNIQISLSANRLLTAAKLANRQVWRRSEESLEFLGMGTTISAILFETGSASVVNIGDSRVYVYRGDALEQLSVDDTVAGAYGNARELPATGNVAIKNVLTQAAGSTENVDPHLRESGMAAGDLILLSSDGLHACVADDEIAAVLKSAEACDEMARKLVDAAKAAGGPDNVSVVVVRYSG